MYQFPLFSSMNTCISPHTLLCLISAFLSLHIWWLKKLSALTCTSLITYMNELFFFACLILTFLSFLANCLFVSVFVCGSVCSGLKAYVSWCYGMDISGNRIQRTARPPRGRSWRVCFPRQLHARFSLRVGFPFSSFSEGPFAFPYLFILPCFGLPCHLVQPYLNMTFQFRYPSSS